MTHWNVTLNYIIYFQYLQCVEVRKSMILTQSKSVFLPIKLSPVCSTVLHQQEVSWLLAHTTICGREHRKLAASTCLSAARSFFCAHCRLPGSLLSTLAGVQHCRPLIIRCNISSFICICRLDNSNAGVRLENYVRVQGHVPTVPILFCQISPRRG